MHKIDKLRNLLVMASLDGKLSEREIRYLMDRCARWEISDAEFTEAIEYALSPDAEVAIPPGKDARIQMLRDLVGMMAADGALTEMESNLFALVAARMEITDQELNALLDSMLRNRGVA